MRHDPYTLVLALSGSRTAQGHLYLDDRNSFAYQQGAYLLQRFTLTSDGVLSGTRTHQAVGFEDKNTIERIVLLGAGHVTQATLVSGVDAHGKTVSNVPLHVQTHNNGKRLVIRKPDIRIGSDFQIKLQ